MNFKTYNNLSFIYDTKPSIFLHYLPFLFSIIVSLFMYQYRYISGNVEIISQEMKSIQIKPGHELIVWDVVYENCVGANILTVHANYSISEKKEYEKTHRLKNPNHGELDVIIIFIITITLMFSVFMNIVLIYSDTYRDSWSTTPLPILIYIFYSVGIIVSIIRFAEYLSL